MKYLFFFLILGVMSACTNTDDPATPECDIEGTVKDYTGLDGCGLLIDLKDGSRLEPVEIEGDFKLKAGQKILFSYEVLTDQASTCQAGDIVRVTCIRETNK